MEQLPGIVLGFLFGILARFIYDWNLDHKEAKSIKHGLLLEILYMHEGTQRLQLDKYSPAYQAQVFRDEDLFAAFWRPKYSTGFYENHAAKIDRLMGPDVCLQVHYYYALVRGLNERSATEDRLVTAEFARGHLEAIAHAYAMGVGAAAVLMEQRGARSAMSANLQSLLARATDAGTRQHVAAILSKYRTHLGA